MKYLLAGFLSGLCCFESYSQMIKGTDYSLKRVVDTSDFKNWALVSNGALSNDGNFALYTIKNDHHQQNSLVIKSLQQEWERKFANASNGFFTQDSRFVVFKNRFDTIFIQSLEKDTFRFEPGIDRFQLISTGSSDWLLYQKKGKQKDFFIRNLFSEQIHQFKNVEDFIISKTGETIALLTSEQQSQNTIYSVQLLSVGDFKTSTIWTSTPENVSRCRQLVFDNSGSQLAFIMESEKGQYSLWHYKRGEGSASILLDSYSTKLPESFELDQRGFLHFSSDGERIFFALKKPQNNQPARQGVAVDVWSYTDPIIQSEQLNRLNNPDEFPNAGRYAAAYNLLNHSIVQLEKDFDRIIYFPESKEDYFFGIHCEGNLSERNWNPSAKPAYYLVSALTGERMDMKRIIVNFSPEGRYAICMDTEARNYYSYEFATGKWINLTEHLPIPQQDSSFDERPGPKPRALKGIETWVTKDEAVLIYAASDIWQLDPKGLKAPLCLTNGFGRRHAMAFKLLSPVKQNMEPNETLLLSAFNKTTKENGFCKIQLGHSQEPKFQSMGPYLYYVDYNQASFQFKNPPFKSKNSDRYLVVRCRADESPNYFWTYDFSTFHPISQVYPEQQVRWLTSELINYTDLSGKKMQGILYKPEGINSSQKYPLIFYYYEKSSDGLNRYFRPEEIEGPINISWFVSHGYLVFTPDINYRMGYPGQSAYTSVMGAYHYLSKLKYVDSKRTGLFGHSFGGFETNYIITHTKVFAAALSGSGISDFISGYGSTNKSGESLQFFYELHQNRIGATLWENPTLYFQNSPVLYADRVSTPVLMMNNKEDGSVPFGQGVEFFMALRRLGKKAWMLQYDGEGHVVFGANALDYTLRITQFFNHYLKGEPAPKWMIKGIPATEKGVDNGMSIY